MKKRIEEFKNKADNWWKKNKKKVLIGAGVACVLAAITYKLSNGEGSQISVDDKVADLPGNSIIPKSDMKCPDVLVPSKAEAVQSLCEQQAERHYSVPFDVNSHIRNLHEGWRASEKKIAEAKSLGIELKPNQTIVDSYIKGVQEV